MMIDFSKSYNLKESEKNKNKNNDEKDDIDLYTTCANIVDFILKASMSRKSFDNVTCLIVAFKDLLNNNDTTKTNLKENNNIIEKNTTKNEGNLENLDAKKSKKDIFKNIDKNEELPKLTNYKSNNELIENNKNDNNEIKKKKKIIIDKIQIKSIQKEDKNKNNTIANKLNKHIELYPENGESPNKNDINSGELSHRAINNNLLKEFKFKVSKTGDIENNMFLSHKNKLTLSTTKMKKTKSKDLLTEKNYKNNNNLDKEKEKEIDNNNPINNINYNSNNKNLSIKKNRLNSTKKYFIDKKIKPLFIENKLTNKNKYPKNYTLKITNFNSNTNANNHNHHTKTGSTLNKLIPSFADLNLYKNINLKDKNPILFSNNIPKITNVNTIMVKNNALKNKITLNDLLTFSNSKNNTNRNNMVGFRLKSLNKKSISFYNNFAFNELITNKNNSDKNAFQKNKQPQLDLYNVYSSNGRNSYANIKNKNRNFIKKQNENKYHFASEDKYKIKLGKPNNIYSENTNNNKNKNKNKNKKYLMNEFKGKKMIHNLTEDLLSEKNPNDMPNIKIKSKINNMPNVKKLNFI
jgi:hypothetical protein